jgi:glycosyltransferase involved in cell wall biosynthesis
MADDELPTVSVILPVRNGAAYLEESLGSIVGQVWRPLEILVFDYGSTDATPEIANSFCGARYFRIDEELPIATSRNIGITQSNGELVAFASHDDVWTREKLWIQAECFRRDPQLEFCLAHVRFFLEHGVTSPPWGFPLGLIGRDLPGRLAETLIVRRETFQRVGAFDEAVRLDDVSEWLGRAQDLGARWTMLKQTLVQKRVYERDFNSSAEKSPRRADEMDEVSTPRTLDHARLIFDADAHPFAADLANNADA